MTSGEWFTLWMTLLGAVVTVGGVFLAAWLGSRLWRRQHQTELAVAAAERALSHLASTRRWLINYRKGDEPQAMRGARDEANAAAAESFALTHYSKDLGERVEEAPYIILDLASKLAELDKLAMLENQVTSRDYVARQLFADARSAIDEIAENVRSVRNGVKRLGQKTEFDFSRKIDLTGGSIARNLEKLTQERSQLSDGQLEWTSKTLKSLRRQHQTLAADSE